MVNLLHEPLTFRCYTCKRFRIQVSEKEDPFKILNGLRLSKVLG